MLSVYLNYPHSRASGHRDPACRFIRMQQKPDQRICRIDGTSLSLEMQRFRDRHYRFVSKSAMNDMWLEITLDDSAAEEAVARDVLRLLGRRYKGFADCRLSFHC